MDQTRTFVVVVAKAADGRAYVPLPFDPDAEWGRIDPHRLHGTLNGLNYRGIVEAIDGGWGLPIGATWRRDCGVNAGDAAHVVLKPEGPLRADLDEDVAAALAAEPAAGLFYDGLAQFYRRAYLRWIDGAKRRPELRAARVTELVELLKAGRKERAS